MDEDPKMMRWLLGGKVDSRRELTFFPWENDGDGLDGVRCVLKVTRGSTVHGGRPWEERTAEGTGVTMDEAFSKAYEELTGWLA